jgi:hypothetical protein
MKGFWLDLFGRHVHLLHCILRNSGVFSSSHLEVEYLGFSFLGIHDPLLIAALRRQYLYKPSLQNVLEELDPVQFVLVLTIQADRGFAK